MLAVNYAFSGTELIGIAAGETDNPKEAVPRAIKTTIGRLVVFFVLTIVVLASLLPMKEAGVSTAPFVDVFDKMGVPFAADIMNFVILTAILSAGNSGLYASSRMLWSLANEGMLSKSVVKINKHGVPMRALLLSMAGAVLSLFSSIYAADTVYLALVFNRGLCCCCRMASHSGRTNQFPQGILERESTRRFVLQNTLYTSSPLYHNRFAFDFDCGDCLG